jgi:hypothetical protein
MTDEAMEAAALLPCPFCGSEASFHEIDNDEDENFGAHFVQCGEPTCSVSSMLRWGDKCDSRPLLAEAWNRRPFATLPDDDGLREPKGCPTPGACSAVQSIAALQAQLATVLRREADNEDEDDD